MERVLYETMCELTADPGMYLYRESDGLFAKQVSTPIGEEDNWVEVHEDLQSQ